MNYELEENSLDNTPRAEPDVPASSEGTGGRDCPFDEQECQRRCKRYFWTELLRTIAKVAGLVLAAWGLSATARSMN